MLILSLLDRLSLLWQIHVRTLFTWHYKYFTTQEVLVYPSTLIPDTTRAYVQRAPKKGYFPQPPFAPIDCAKASISSRERLVWAFVVVVVLSVVPKPVPKPAPPPELENEVALAPLLW